MKNGNVIVCTLLAVGATSYAVGRASGLSKGREEGQRQGKAYLDQARVIQINNAKFVENEQRRLNEKIKEINRAQKQIEEFYKDF